MESPPNELNDGNLLLSLSLAAEGNRTVPPLVGVIAGTKSGIPPASPNTPNPPSPVKKAAEESFRLLVSSSALFLQLRSV